MPDQSPPSSGKVRILTCQAEDVRLGDGKMLAMCRCPDRWMATVALCAADAARSHLDDSTYLCTRHEVGYLERLKSLKCSTPGCRLLVTTATTPDQDRSDSARLRSAGDLALGRFCCTYTVVGVDETSQAATLDRFGVHVGWSDTRYQGDPNSPARPLSAAAKDLRTARQPVVLRVLLGGTGYFVRARPSYATLRERPELPPEIFLFATGHNIILALPETTFSSDAGRHIPREFIQLADVGQLLDTVSYETLTTEGGGRHLCFSLMFLDTISEICDSNNAGLRWLKVIPIERNNLKFWRI